MLGERTSDNARARAAPARDKPPPPPAVSCIGARTDDSIGDMLWDDATVSGRVGDYDDYNDDDDYVELNGSATPETTPEEKENNSSGKRGTRGSYLWDVTELRPPVEVSPWDCRGLSRVRVRSYLVAILSNGVVGDFIVRDREAEPDTLAITIKTRKHKYATYCIEPAGAGRVRVRGSASDTFATVQDLVDFYSKTSSPVLNGVKLALYEPVNVGLGRRCSSSDDSSGRDSYLSLLVSESASLSKLQSSIIAARDNNNNSSSSNININDDDDTYITLAGE